MSDSKWVPSTDFEDEIPYIQSNADFEDEIQAIQPECDATFENYGDDPGQSLFNRFNPYEYDTNNEIPDSRRDLNLVQRITRNCSWLFDDPIGRQMTPEDLENNNTRERETILMMRKHGVAPSIDEKLDSKLTIPAISSDKPFKKGGRILLLYDGDYFKLKARNSVSGSSGSKSGKSSSTEGSSNEISKDEGEIVPDASCAPLEQNSASIMEAINIPDWLTSKSRRKIAAQFNGGVPAKNSDQNVRDLKAIREAMTFVTPFERYKQKRQRDISE